MSTTRSAQACFEALPNEILFRIFYSLDAKFVVSVVSKVCTRFSAVLSDSSFWQQKLFLRWPKKYPVAPGESAANFETGQIDFNSIFPQTTKALIGRKPALRGSASLSSGPTGKTRWKK